MRQSHRPLLAAVFATAISLVPLDGSQLGASPADRDPATRAGAPNRAAAPRPNVVLITADDMRPDDLRAMPFTSGVLAERGVRFRDAISPHNLCCPARAEIVSGRYGHNSGVMGNVWPNGGYWSLRRHRNTLPVWLKDAGYRTGFVGKYMNGYGSPVPKALAGEGRSRYEIPPGWDHWWASLKGTYSYTHATMRIKEPGRQARTRAYDRYQTVLYSDIADGMIDSFERARDADPFFVWYSSATPHTAVGNEDPRPIPQPKYANLFSESRPGRGWSERINEPTDDKAGPMHSLRPRDRSQLVRLHIARMRSLRSLDDAVKAMVTTLRENGELSNTVLIFTSDNGFALGEHRTQGKTMPYEAMLEVPMVVVAPGLRERYHPDVPRPELVTSDLTITTLDIPSTIVDVARASTPWPMEGVNLLYPRRNPDFGSGVRGVLVNAGSSGPTRTDVRMFAGVRTDRWTYFGYDAAVRTRDGRRGLHFNVRDRFGPDTGGFRELYDLKDHPLQLTNLFGQHPVVTERLRSMLNQRFDCRGQGCVFSASGVR
ncbi:MAG: sulfatase-like hydrolase/transferase [Acidimicrobiia bacterium]|nr:sulfatase-like hydrolase/transferase [Acidimicrobiia bacterium]